MFVVKGELYGVVSRYVYRSRFSRFLVGVSFFAEVDAAEIFLDEEGEDAAGGYHGQEHVNAYVWVMISQFC